VSDNLTLPTGPNAGQRDEWVLPVGREGDGRALSLRDATFLGFSSTQTSRHTGHDGAEHAEPKTRCSACRWYETRLFRVHDGQPHHYVVHHLGASRAPGEVALCRYQDAWSAHEVVELFTQRPNTDETDDRGRPRTPFLTRPGARVLAQAASYDDEIDDAFVNRAVI
jgi:hypothetical protein